MSDRDWEKELAKIDKQLASISDEELAKPVAPPSGKPAALPAGGGTGMPRGAAATAARSAPAGGDGTTTRTRLWALTKLGVAAAGAVAITIWPWPARCGIGLAGLVGASGFVVLLGVWSAFGTWRARLGLAHLAALLVIAWGGVIGAREVLPRVGYAIPTFDRPDRWECQVAPPGADDPASPNASPEAAPGAAGTPTAPDGTPLAPRRTL